MKNRLDRNISSSVFERSWLAPASCSNCAGVIFAMNSAWNSWPWSRARRTNSSRGMPVMASQLNASSFTRSNLAGVFTTRFSSKRFLMNSLSNFSTFSPGLQPLSARKLQTTSGR